MTQARKSAPDLPLDDEFVEALQKRLGLDPMDLDGLAAAGVMFLDRDEPQKALECFHRITRQDAAYPGVWRLKAQAFEALGDPESARICRKHASDAEG